MKRAIAAFAGGIVVTTIGALIQRATGWELRFLFGFWAGCVWGTIWNWRNP